MARKGIIHAELDELKAHIQELHQRIAELEEALTSLLTAPKKGSK